MKTSAIRHPENSLFTRRHDWQIKALLPFVPDEFKRRSEVPHTAAEMLSILEFHYNNRFANRVLRELMDRARAKHGELKDLGDWMPYSENYWVELLLDGRGKHVIRGALQALVDPALGFLSTEVPADITEFYSANFTWLRLNVDAINEWIDLNIEKTWKVDWRAGQGTRVRGIFGQHPEDPTPEAKPAPGVKAVHDPKEAPEIPQRVENLTTMASKISAIAAYYKHIHGKNASFIMDNVRKGKVEKRLKEGRTLGMCAQVILGNRYSEWHQGQHKDNFLGSGGKVFDDIELMFRNAVNFEKHLAIADEKKITEDIAFKDLAAYLDGQPSRHAKKGKKTPQTASNEQPEAIEPGADLTDTEQTRYRVFARSIAGFFATDVENKAILEIVRENGNLKEQSAGLIDAGYLDQTIQTAVKTFRPSGLSREMEDQIHQFSTTFAKLEGLKKS